MERYPESLMSKTFRPYDPEQQLLLPATLHEWLPPDHLAYFVSDVLDQLDLSAITSFPATVGPNGLFRLAPSCCLTQLCVVPLL